MARGRKRGLGRGGRATTAARVKTRINAAFTCVCAGSTHQQDPKYLGNNAQCVAMSTCAAVYSCITNRQPFSGQDIDAILDSGDKLYLSVKPLYISHSHPHLYPEELPSEFPIINFFVKIKPLADSDSWIDNGLFPKSKSAIDFNIALNGLKTILETKVFNSDTHNDHTDNYLFTGTNNTVSFWRHENQYYFFNSHKIDENNRYVREDVNTFNCAARLFKCNDLISLSELLFWNPGIGTEYQIHKIILLNFFDLNLNDELQTDNITTLHDSKLNLLKPVVVVKDIGDPKLTLMKPVVRLLNLSAISKPAKRGRPAKLERGTIKTNILKDPKLTILKPIVVLEKILCPRIKNSERNSSAGSKRVTESKKRRRYTKSVEHGNTHAKAAKKYIQNKPNCHMQAVQNYTQQHPDVHRQAVQKYTKKHPDVHRKAVQKYTKQYPDINRQAVHKYTKEHPNVHRQAVHKYTQQHPDTNKIAVQKYNEVSRNLDVDLRPLSNLIAHKCGDELNVVQLFSLKKISLLDDNIHTCQHCRTRLFFEESKRVKWCCGAGAYNVQNFPDLNEEFYHHPAFVNRPRAYNNLFSFSALGVSHGFQHPPSGFTFLKIQGRIYHRVFDLSYSDTTNPVGLYIEDNEERERLAQGLHLDVQVIRCITNFLHSVNPYIECFKRLSQVPSTDAHIVFEPTSRRTHGNILGDMPVGREVAALISTEKERFIPRCIAIWKEGGRKPHTVDILHPLYESFQYPLLYPHGNPGWYPNKLDNKGAKLSQVKYVRCLLLSESRFHNIGRLSEEWLVDMYCRISEERLRYITESQSKSNNNQALRCAPFHELESAARQIAGDETIQGEGGVVPGRVYLPSSFTGGPRYMKQKYMDAIAIVNRLGIPSFFLTFTCNANWPEIKESLLAGQKSTPSLCSRVFNLKLTQLLKDLRSGAWFGKIVYIIYVIEFQKRGLPHAHICFAVHGGGPVQSTDIDKFVRADIPDVSEANGRLQKLVLEHMIHGPCGPPHRADLPCWDVAKGKCSKYFPKKEASVTFCDAKGFVHLRRDSNNIAVTKYRNRDICVNDLWVVPYNAALLLKYQCHMNLEVCSTRSVIKYLFKYITKGQDESRVAIVTNNVPPPPNPNDEVENFVTKRYIGSCDAAWRVFEFDIIGREPTVKMLAVHLENYQSVFFKPGNEGQAIKNSESDLLTYFKRPLGPDFDNLTYLDFFENYIVHASRPSIKNGEIFELTNGKFLTKRLRGEVVTRLFWVAPNRGEQFYLRLLLGVFPCRGYIDLYNIGGPNCTTFQEAAKAAGIADDDTEYEKAMQEAASFLTGRQLRNFFVLLAVNGISVASLWEKFKNNLSEDFLLRFNNDHEKSYSSSLIQIDRQLRKHGTCLKEQGLPIVFDSTTELDRERTQYNFKNLKEFVASWTPKLSNDQRIVFDYVQRLMIDIKFRDSNNCAIFIDGPAGTGKSLLLQVITAYVRSCLNGIVLCTASSGIAAQNYEGGTTAHSMFRFPLNPVDDLGYWNITNGSQRAALISNADLIIYDEAPMAHKYLIHLLDRSLKDLTKSNKAFGGKVIIFAGDFRQLPPVVTNANSKSDIINSSVKSSPIWQNLKTFKLTTSQRCNRDSDFADFLLKVGSNQLNSSTLRVGRTIQNLIDLSNISFVTDLDDLIDFVFPQFILENEPEICVNRAILSTHNSSIKDINRLILARLPGQEFHFHSVDKTSSDDADQIYLGPDVLNEMQPPGVPSHKLTLKIGCVCIIMRNLSFADQLVNGTKVIVEATSPRLITVRKPGIAERYLIPRIEFKTPIEHGSPIEMCRLQFPLQVSYAMTIHKSQGQTINRVGIDLRSDIFSHGQLYVALGRVRELSDIKILIHKDKLFDNRPYVNNIVIQDLL